ncbi:hypothetical protein HPP92_011694 [Vanilla planifolia]|uniref:Glutaredoxin domain-containing protein n=1 Tax=Vanilla planifolia TaxID=51239 RepID=A0A835V2L7_VANPL|nr:hypothetical protein HPP92_011694 [Vanilla planifolia]
MEVKALFKRIGVEPLVIELDQLGPQGPQLQKVLERLTGQFTVPNVFLDCLEETFVKVARHQGGVVCILYDLYHLVVDTLAVAQIL